MGIHGNSNIKLVRRSTTANVDATFATVVPARHPIPDWLGDQWFSDFLAGEPDDARSDGIPEEDLQKLNANLRKMFTGAPGEERNITVNLKQHHPYRLEAGQSNFGDGETMLDIVVQPKSEGSTVALLRDFFSTALKGKALLVMFPTVGLRLSPKQRRKLVTDIQSQITELLHYGEK